MQELYIPTELQEVADRVRRGERTTHSVRIMLSWFYGYQRRSAWVVAVIRKALEHLELQTDPDFNLTYLDAPLTFLYRPAHPSIAIQPTAAECRTSTAGPTVVIGEPPRKVRDAIHSIGKFADLVTNTPVVVAPDDTVARATTIMLEHNYSQLPVMRDKKTVDGVSSWKSLGWSRSIGKEPHCVREAIEAAEIITYETTLFEAISLIEEHDCVLVRNPAGEICSIITPFDVGAAFHSLSQPFLVLQQIENRIRGMIENKFSWEEIAAVFPNSDFHKNAGPREKIIDRLTFGNYKTILASPDRWSRFGLSIDRETFLSSLNEVRDIRNRLMHFNPDDNIEKSIARLRRFAGFLERIQDLGK